MIQYQESLVIGANAFIVCLGFALCAVGALCALLLVCAVISAAARIIKKMCGEE